MAFRLVESGQDPSPSKPSDQSNEALDFVKGLPEAALRTVTIPASAAAERIGGFPGDIVETPSGVTQLLYSMFGKPAPEWTQGPSSLRLNEQGQVRPGLMTTEEIREGKPFGELGVPRNSAENRLQGAGDIAGTLLTGGVRNPRALATGTGAIAGIREAGQHFNVPPGPTAIAEAAIGLATTARGGGHPSQGAITPEGQRLTNIAQAENIRHAPAAIQDAGRRGASRFLRAWGRAGETVRERAQQFSHEIQDAYHNVLGTIHQPYNQERNLQVLQNQAGNLFNPVNRLAQTGGQRIHLNQNRILRTIYDQIDDIRRTRSPTTAQTEAIRILENTAEEIMNRGLNLDQGVQTFRSYNKHIDWEAPTRNDTNLRNVKEAIREEIQNQGSNIRGFNEAFNMSNQAYHELAQLREASEILGRSFNANGTFNLGNFAQSVANPQNETQLVNILGQRQFDRLRDIAHLSEEGRRNFQAVGALLPEELQTLNQAIGRGTSLIQGVTSATAEVLGRNFAARILTNPNLQQNYIGYLRALRNESPKLVAYYLRKMNGELKSKEKEKTFTLVE